ncbi:hypothetical protein [Halomicrobium salinisoli]|uniref:hypothetical protein n=1 Tax=Halomicrobium salinisoli TaxID=2878391 RepID=UPI001CF03FE3|nr:hypothetical protein [Halomicrobium salinisoli]
MTTTDDDAFSDLAEDFETWLAMQSQDGVPDLVLVGLLRGYADEIERHGYVPRSWLSDE